MKPLKFTLSFQKKLQDLNKKDVRLVNKIKKQLQLFQINPQHPSLRLHKLKGELSNTWSISITRDFRVLYYERESYYFFDLGTHDEVYKK